MFVHLAEGGLAKRNVRGKLKECSCLCGSCSYLGIQTSLEPHNFSDVFVYTMHSREQPSDLDVALKLQ